jgi:hypothetical protein
VLTHRRLRHTTLPHLRLAGAYPLENVGGCGSTVGRVRSELGRRVGSGQAVTCPVVIPPQGRQRLQGPGPPQAVAPAMRSTLEAGGADPQTAPPERW